MNEPLNDAERAQRAAQELKGFEIDITQRTDDEMHKICNLIMVYQSATQALLKKNIDDNPIKQT